MRSTRSPFSYARVIKPRDSPTRPDDRFQLFKTNRGHDRSQRIIFSFLRTDQIPYSRRGHSLTNSSFSSSVLQRTPRTPPPRLFVRKREKFPRGLVSSSARDIFTVDGRAVVGTVPERTCSGTENLWKIHNRYRTGTLAEMF